MPTNAAIGPSAGAGGTWSLASPNNTAQIGRVHDLALLMQGSLTNLGQARAGLFVGVADSGQSVPTCWVVETGGGTTLTVRAGAAAVERNTKVGPYLVVSEGSLTIALNTADATNPRIDRIDLQVLDGSLGDNSGTSLTQVVVTTGTPAGSPVVPAAPANSVPIAQVSVPANQGTITSGLITHVRKSTALAGTPRLLLEGDLVTDAGSMVGELRDTSFVRSANPTLDRWNGTSWVLVNDLGAAVAKSLQFTAAQTLATTTSTTYTNINSSGTLCGTSFVAPASGITRVGFGVSAFSSVNGSTVVVTPVIATGGTVGSGTQVFAASDDRSMTYSDTAADPGYKVFTATGLTPGSTYNVWLQWKNTGSATANGNRPFVDTLPVLH